MGIRFDVVSSKGKVLNEYTDAACFSYIWHNAFGDWGIQYYPEIQVDPLDAIEFLTGMKEAGFHISDPAVIVLDKKYLIPTYESPYGTPVARAWVFGNLTLVRYLHEFTRIVNEYCELKKLLPEANPYHLLQMAHVSCLNGSGSWFGQGHVLMDTTWGYYPERYLSWESVKERFSAGEKRVQGMFRGRFGTGLPSEEAKKLLRSPDGVRSLHERASAGEPAKDIHHQPTVLSGAVQRPLFGDDAVARG